jgi:hypothetical protein
VLSAFHFKYNPFCLVRRLSLSFILPLVFFLSL